MMSVAGYRPVRWVIELDYDADPDTDADTLMIDIADQMSGAKGSPVMEGEYLVLDHLDDAVSARLRFADHITRIDTEYV